MAERTSITEELTEPDAKMKAHWRLMEQWERATETVSRREWELIDAKAALTQAKKNLKEAQENEAKIKAAIEPLSILEGAC